MTAAALATIAVSPSTATVTVGGRQTFTATGADQYGNPVDVSNASWTTSYYVTAVGPGGAESAPSNEASASVK